MNSVRTILLMVCMGCMTTACYYPQTDHEDEWDLTESRRDSIDFEKTHHYTHNFNFMVVADSITLYATLPNSYSIGNVGVADSFNVTRDDRLVGFILLGNVERAGIYTSLVRERTPLSTIDFELIRETPQLMAFSATERAVKLGGGKYDI